ncbi:MAG: purine-nucleoside phosphorylase [Clostridia bacterium]|nr:purine-nucleoside phosphorylase [Clostridia bacterium]
MATAHINAAYGDFASTVLMPGDPLRAKLIAEKYLENAKLVNNVRGVQGYTGSYKGKPVSVMASGMGMPSIGIYSYELYKFFGVNHIIRVGSAGALREDIRVRDVVIGMGCSTDSNYAANYNLPGTFAPLCSYETLETCVSCAKRMGIRHRVGNLLSTDVFYGDDETANARWAGMGIMAVEMEGAALYMNAARLGKDALVVCTVSNHILTGEELSAEERQNSFDEMITLALETAHSLD